MEKFGVVGVYSGKVVLVDRDNAARLPSTSVGRPSRLSIHIDDWIS